MIGINEHPFPSHLSPLPIGSPEGRNSKRKLIFNTPKIQRAISVWRVLHHKLFGRQILFMLLFQEHRADLGDEVRTCWETWTLALKRPCFLVAPSVREFYSKNSLNYLIWGDQTIKQ